MGWIKKSIVNEDLKEFVPYGDVVFSRAEAFDFYRYVREKGIYEDAVGIGKS